jgi:hypothetical protein
VGPVSSNSFPYAGMIQVRFKGYDLRLDPATPERIRSKNSEFSRNCQAAAGFLSEGSAAICKIRWLYCVEVPEKGTVHVYGISRNLEETQKIEADARRVPGVSEARSGNQCRHRRLIGRGWQEKGGVAPRRGGA